MGLVSIFRNLYFQEILRSDIPLARLEKFPAELSDRECFGVIPFDVENGIIICPFDELPI